MTGLKSPPPDEDVICIPAGENQMSVTGRNDARALGVNLEGTFERNAFSSPINQREMLMLSDALHSIASHSHRFINILGSVLKKPQ